MAGAMGAGLASKAISAPLKKSSNEEDIRIIRYRTLGRTGFRVSDIGFGASFLTNPRVMEIALDKGVNYFDTAEHYSAGMSEMSIGQAIQGRDRKSMFITTKLNLNWGGSANTENIKFRFRKSLERMQTDYADCLMIHMCTDPAQVKHTGFHSAVRELKAEGRVRYIGLSNHGLEQRIYGNLEVPMEQVMLAAAEDGRFDVGLFVYNFLQKEQGEKIIAAFRKKNMGVTLMKTNPVKVYKRWKTTMDNREAKGRDIPDRVRKLGEDYAAWLEKADEFKKKYGLQSDEQVREAAIKFVITNPDVHTVCASINSFEQLDAFVKLSGQDLKTTDTSMLLDYGTTLGAFYCRHACGTCESACPKGVPVNTILRYNHYFEAQGMEKHAMQCYAGLERKADVCGDCDGDCESACPYQVKTRSLMVAAHQNLTLA
jgi:predicted aldo/keto reductase-like oxidoreductase